MFLLYLIYGSTHAAVLNAVISLLNLQFDNSSVVLISFRNSRTSPCFSFYLYLLDDSNSIVYNGGIFKQIKPRRIDFIFQVRYLTIFISQDLLDSTTILDG